MLKAAIFDFDGTLLDSNYVWETAGDRFFESIGIDNLQQEIRTMILYQSDCYIREEYGLSLAVEEIMEGINRAVENCYFPEVQPKQGVISFLRELKAADVRMCIATATDRYQIEAALRRCDMLDFFEGIFTCSEVGYGKDEPLFSGKPWNIWELTEATPSFLKMHSMRYRQPRQMVF